MDTGKSLREIGRGESAAEVLFWERYWQALREAGVAAGKEVWHERQVQRYLRFVRPRRLKETVMKDVTDWLTSVATQPGAEAWRVRQADVALTVLYRTEETYVGWAVRFLGYAGGGQWSRT